MDSIIVLLCSPLLLIVVGILLKMEIVKKKEIDAGHEKYPENNVYLEHRPSVNKRRGHSLPAEFRRNEIKPKSKLEVFLEQHGKQIAFYMERDTFTIPLSCCKEIVHELNSYLNNLSNIEYALVESDGIHVKVHRAR